MITVVAKNFIKEENIQTALKMYEELVSETRKENGCISYCLFQAVDNKKKFVFIEEWESQEHLKAHFETPHFKKIVPAVGELSDAAEDSGVDILEKVL